jgi:hypothetical protein
MPRAHGQSASAPEMISINSLVIAAWRRRGAVGVEVLLQLPLQELADMLANRQDLDRRQVRLHAMPMLAVQRLEPARGKHRRQNEGQ